MKFTHTEKIHCTPTSTVRHKLLRVVCDLPKKGKCCGQLRREARNALCKALSFLRTHLFDRGPLHLLLLRRMGGLGLAATDLKNNNASVSFSGERMGMVLRVDCSGFLFLLKIIAIWFLLSNFKPYAWSHPAFV